MASGRREPMKVVIINTKYVETDARSFKSVVQELTGKDSGATRSRFYQEHINSKKDDDRGIDQARGTSRSRDNSILMKNLSFKEFERLLMEMPPVDDSLWINMN